MFSKETGSTLQVLELLRKAALVGLLCETFRDIIDSDLGHFQIWY